MAIGGLLLFVVVALGCVILIGAAIAVVYVVAHDRDARKDRG
jgi:hypothetical protein